MKRIAKIPSFLTFFLFVSSCAEYRLVTPVNPLGQYEIHSLSVPTFINQSGLPNAASPFTHQMILMLSAYPSLKVYSGENRKADALLLGIIRSPEHMRNIVKTSEKIYVESELSGPIGKRKPFLVPSASQYRLVLQIALIKNPTYTDRQLLQSKIGSLMKKNPKVIFNELIPLSGNFQREVRETTTSASPGMLNFTKTKRHFAESLVALGKEATSIFKETVLNAF